VQVVALTLVKKPATFTNVISFITEWGVSFSVGKDSGKMSERFGVGAVPAAALVRNGQIIWRGNAKRITSETIEKALKET